MMELVSPSLHLFYSKRCFFTLSRSFQHDPYPPSSLSLISLLCLPPLLIAPAHPDYGNWLPHPSCSLLFRQTAGLRCFSLPRVLRLDSFSLPTGPLFRFGCPDLTKTEAVQLSLVRADAVQRRIYI